MKQTNDRSVQRVFVAIGIAAAIFGGVMLFSRLLFSKKPSETHAITTTTAPPSVERPERSSERDRVARAELTLRGAAAKLNSAQSTKNASDLLRELRATLGSLSADAASQLVQQFLAAGTDARTYLPFALGSGGGFAGRAFSSGLSSGLSRTGRSRRRSPCGFGSAQTDGLV